MIAVSIARSDDPQVRGHLGEQFSVEALRKVRGWLVVDNLPFDRMDVDPPTRMLGHHLPGGFLEHAAAPTADHTVCTQLDEPLHHDPAQPGAASGDEEAFALEEIAPEHRSLPVALAVWSSAMGSNVTRTVAPAFRGARISA